MQYFVVAEDGIKYGPADEETLKEWVTQKRVARNTLLEEEGTRQRLRAESLRNLFSQEEPDPGPEVPPVIELRQELEVPAVYPRSPLGGDASRELANAWIWTALGVLFFPIVFPAIGLVYANRAIERGSESANNARIFAITVLIAQIAVILMAALLIGFFGYVLSESG